ncbi:MAG: MBL fold metallo-hydrolase [Deltaproteobacteria bacterium]|mgnify:FL=1|jgi:hydroxyacylglutathione hydrolase|nr:MBL fold metallo-hydrolase [Deltaproteobacteria bacterium]MBT4637808.1 MBL fold metallo-hydrolase [Deltaproteobacteria bacterium]MBT6498736.1 MBL fold metallo-hydrolase [Deltaproteobacteria bacterium]MBT7156170.1 MBL fold metallo-hydrolase [Deltaproteobacteria bacterium]MBT7716687.1 MBL fold metallo-hydrolase [Deltaproteobacteria bacterium]
MKRTRITDTIEYIEPTDIPSNISCSAVVVSSSPKIVIDLNLSDSDTESVLKEIRPDQSYISHYHIDHSRGWQAIEKFSNADYFIPRGEEQFLSDRNAFLKHTPGNRGNVETWKIFLEQSGYREIEKYRVFDGSHRIKTGSSTIECIATAGHSPSHTSFYFPTERILFAGDLGLSEFGPWYGWESCDIGSYVESLLRLKSLKTDILLTSHEGIIRSEIDAVWDNCLSQFFLREQSIREQLDAGKTKQEIVALGIYFTNKDRVKEPMKSVITIWDAIMLDHHLKILESDSLAARFPELSALPFTPN